MPTAGEIAAIAEQRARTLDRLALIRREDFVGEDSFEPITIYEHLPYRRTPGFGFYRDIADRFSSINAYMLVYPLSYQVDAYSDLIVPELKLKDTVVDENDDAVFIVRDTRPSSFETARTVLADRIG
jgi:hypothetical protein